MEPKFSAFFLAGDHYHDPQIAFDGVVPILEAAGAAAQTTSDYTLLNHANLVGKHLLVLHRDGMLFPNGINQPAVRWMTRDQETAIEDFVLAGGSFLALHNSGWDYPFDGPYRRVLGGYYLTHPAIARFQVRVVDPAHPVTQGVENYEIEDEQHWLWWDYDRVTLLLTNHGADGRQSAAGWAYQHGKGRVVFLANGHTAQAHTQPQFMRLKENAIRWLLEAP
jgi:type 1 glutamine amidotransferase